MFRYVPVQSGYFTIFLILCFTISFNIPRFFELKIVVIPNCNSNIYLVQPTNLRLSSSYSSIIMLSSVIINIIPTFCLIFINNRIIKAIKKQTKILASLSKRKVSLLIPNTALVCQGNYIFVH